MNGSYLNKILNLRAKHALYREDGKWYHNLKKFPGILFDKNGYIIFNNEEEYSSSPELQIRQDLHIVNGIENLSQYRKFTGFQKKLITGIIEDESSQKENDEEITRIRRELDIILRKKYLVYKIKNLYNNTCQICSTQLEIGKNKYYSEVHHIIPLGKPYNGSDTLENMICVCPNCHIRLDYKAIPLSIDFFRIIKHTISSENIEFHNSLIAK